MKVLVVMPFKDKHKALMAQNFMNAIQTKN